MRKRSHGELSTKELEVYGKFERTEQEMPNVYPTRKVPTGQASTSRASAAVLAESVFLKRSLIWMLAYIKKRTGITYGDVQDRLGYGQSTASCLIRFMVTDGFLVWTGRQRIYHETGMQQRVYRHVFAPKVKDYVKEDCHTCKGTGKLRVALYEDFGMEDASEKDRLAEIDRRCQLIADNCGNLEDDE